ncbi:putative CDC9-DNA ligase I [Serendipita vermifera]|nr:putative CDC9-DNA ligase I [Serendipita vermifera]
MERVRPQQSSLSDLWKKKAAKSEPTTMMETEAATEDSIRQKAKRKSSPPQVDEDADGDVMMRPATKKRRVVTSDDEEELPEPKSTSSKAKLKKLNDLSRTKITKPKKAASSRASSPPPTDEERSIALEMESRAEDEEPGEDELSEAASEEVVAISKTAEQLLKNEFTVDFKGAWPAGEPAPYALITQAFSLIEGTTKRIEKTSYLTSLLYTVISRSRGVKGDKPPDTESLLQTIYLCINRLSPDYIGIELGIGESLLIKAISESTGRPIQSIKAELKKEGDLGLVAMHSKASQRTIFKPKPLTVPHVFARLKEIALTSGAQSQAKKTGIITKLLAACQATIAGSTSSEAKFIIRSLEGKLRIGLAERTVLVSLAHAVVMDEKERGGKSWSKEKLSAKLEEATSILKQVYSEIPSYDIVIPALMEHGIADLKKHCKLTPGIPLKPMLAKPTKAIGEVLDKFEGKKFTCEYKYDGERAQVHRQEDGTVSVFSRNSEDMSKKYPDLMAQLPHCIKEGTTSFVFDAEAVAIDKTTGKLMPFQELSRRKRKDVKVEDITVRVCLFAFDLLYLNGEPLLHRSLEDRRALLRQHFTPVPFEFDFAKASDGETTEEIQLFLEESVKDGCEGLMVKMLQSDESFYEPSRRSVNWLKLKKDYLAGIGDSLDLVVVGGYYGKGKRTAVYGAFLLACYDADNEEWQTICKIGTGFSDEALQEHAKILKELEIGTLRGDVKPGGAKPDVWFEPKVVWEVLTADLSLSPIYTAAQGLVDQRGISLRFPRFIRIRDDKNADDATGPEQIAEMYERQALAQSKGKKGGDGDDDFW